MKGRKKLPDKIKQIQGTDRRDRMSGDRPIFKLVEVSNMPEPPTYMNEVAANVYHEVCKQMIELGLVNNANFPLMVSYAQNIGKYHDAEMQLAKEGFTIEVRDEAGLLVKKIVNPLNRISNEAMALALRIGSEFGLTPSAQTKIMSLIKKPETNPFDDI